MTLTKQLYLIERRARYCVKYCKSNFYLGANASYKLPLHCDETKYMTQILFNGPKLSIMSYEPEMPKSDNPEPDSGN